MNVRYARAIAGRTRVGAAAILRSFGLCFFLVVTPGFVSAEECTADKAQKVAEERHGGKAIAVWVDGDYFIVRLEYGDRVFDVGINRWNC